MAIERSLLTAVFRNLVAKAVCADKAESPSYSGVGGLLPAACTWLDVVSGEEPAKVALGVACLEVRLARKVCGVSR